ncbi:MAG TPA: 2Fe-2S iron-sulfur cluster binding domain-containing protein [Mogibacterium sp.]|nr:2Fe-2S iron-sulfur cluster binding domain-containing protein [Mogibacterium sp.]
MVSLTINGKKISVLEGTTIMDAAKEGHIRIPHLCYLKDINDIGACRVCVVEVEGLERLVTACNNVVEEGMIVHTDSPRARKARRLNVKLLLSQHDSNCTLCNRSGNCSLQTLANDLGIMETAYEKELTLERWNKKYPLIRDANKCIKCMRCIQICDKIQTMNVWDVSNTGGRTTVDVSGNRNIDEINCALCGQCITHCPVGALSERDDVKLVLDALADEKKVVIVQVAPAVRTAWGESLGLSSEKATVKRMAATLKSIGFDYVFDTTFTADLTIMEEGSEFLAKLKNAENEKFPMFTSCCPGWVRFIKYEYPEFVGQLSSAKSPQQMFGAVTKTYLAEKLGIDPANIFNVSIMPCTAKKYECSVSELSDAGFGQDVDVVLTTRELARMIKAEHIIVEDIPEEDFDSPLGVGSGAGVIFGATGGVMEAALRSVYYLVEGENPDPDLFKGVRGLDGWKEATVTVGGTEVRAAIASGLGNARKLMEAVKRGEVDYHFVEIMACPGGCSGGGGQPIHDGQELAGERSEYLYGLDKHDDLRFSHENPEVIQCYKEYFGEPLSERSHHLLHTDQELWNLRSEN